MVAICRLELEKDPRNGVYFVFINRSRTMIRVLVYDGNGFWLMTKRLSKGKFQGWPISPFTTSSLEAKQLRTLLTGIDVSQPNRSLPSSASCFI